MSPAADGFSALAAPALAVRVLHRPGPVAESRAIPLASEVEVADSQLQKARGLMLRRLPEDGALVFPFDGVRSRTVHTLLVPEPIDVVWTVDGDVVRVSTMRAWFDLARATADRLVELPAGAAADVEAGDRVVVE